MIKRELREVSAMRRKVSELEESIARAKKGGLMTQVKILEKERDALKRSVQSYEDNVDPQGKQRKG